MLGISIQASNFRLPVKPTSNWKEALRSEPCITTTCTYLGMWRRFHRNFELSGTSTLTVFESTVHDLYKHQLSKADLCLLWLCTHRLATQNEKTGLLRFIYLGF